MPRTRLRVVGALAAIDVLLGLTMNLLADAIGTAAASVVAGTIFLAVIITFGKLLGDAGRRAPLALSLIGAVVLFAIAAHIAPRETVQTVASTSTLSPTATTAPPPRPQPLSLSQYLSKWQNGPVKIDIEHYNSWVERASEDGAVDRTNFDLRVRIRNESTVGIDLANAPDSLVLLTNQPFGNGKYDVDQKRIPEVPAAWYLYAVGFKNDYWNVTAGDKDHSVNWSGGILAVGQEFSAASPSENGVAYTVPPPATKTGTENDAVSPLAAHVLGLAWLGPDQTIQGYTPIERWTGPNTMSSFLHA